MKRKIVLGLATFTVLFVLSGAYIARTCESATDDLDRLISLHRVEILREQYLLHLRRLESDLRQDSRRPGPAAEAASNVHDLRSLIGSCFNCHHSPDVTQRLNSLRLDTDAYQAALDLARSSPAAATDAEVLRVGERAMRGVRDIIDETTAGLERNTRSALQAIARTRLVMYAVLGIVPLLAVSLGLMLVSELSRPLRILLESTRRLKRGELDHRVAGLKDEFGELEVAFNDMAVSLKEQMQRMQRTEQMVVAGQLATGLAHEIKNPLGGIKAAMQVLSAEGHFPEADRRVLGNVVQEVAHVESLMRQFLQFARPAKPQLVEMNVNEVVKLTLGFYRLGKPDRLDRPGAIRVVEDLQPLPTVLADPGQLQQVLLNLVLNAADSMPGGGVLEVRTRLGEGGGRIVIEVSDTGRGIAAENVQKIFQPFFTTKAKGTGLGLATSKQLVEQHGGSISLAANAAGGTTFRVQLPLPRSEVTAA